MKKILALALALLIVGSSASLVACGGEEDKPDTEAPGTEEPGTETPGTEQPGTETPGTSDSTTMTEVNEQVIVNATVYYRLAPSYDSPALDELHVGTVLTRTGVSEEWSRIRLENGTASAEFYTVSSCLKLYTGTQPEDPSDNPSDEPTTPGDQPTTPGDDPSTPGDQPSTPTDPTEFVEISPAEKVYVTTDVLNIRSEPSTSGQKIGSVEFAASFERVAKNNEWSRINYQGNTYYVYSEYLTTENITGSDYVEVETATKMTVTASVLNVRTHPYVSDDTYMEYQIVMRQLNKGDTVTILAEAPSGTWVRVMMTDGAKGYVNGKYLSGYEGATGDETITPTTPTTPTVNFNPLTPVVMYPEASGVAIYSVCDDTTTPFKTLSRNEAVRVIAVSEDGVWYKINLSATDTTPYYVWTSKLASSGKS